MRIKLSLMAAAFALFWAFGATAQTPTDTTPYEARVPVTDPATTNRDDALRAAMRIVIARISGPDAPDQAADLLDRAPQLVQRFGYDRAPDGSPVFVAAFDGSAVENGLKALGLPIWGVVAAEVEAVRVSVSGVASAADYLRVLGSLQSLSLVHRVNPIHATGDRLELDVQAEGGAGRLSGALLSSDVLAPDPAGSTADLAYRWVGTAASP